MIDFVTRSQEALSVEAPEPVDPPDFEEAREETSEELDEAAREAEEKGWQPQKNLLRVVKTAVEARTEDQPRPELAEKFERAAEKLPEEQKQHLPAAFDTGVSFLRENFRVSSTDATVETGAADQTQPETPLVPDPVEPAPAEVDPLARQFVERWKADAFTPGGNEKFTEEQLADALPAEDRAAFMALPPEERKFIATLDDKHQVPYAQLPFEEAELFRTLEPGERGQFLAMSPDEREVFRTLDPDERAAYLLLHPDQRELVRVHGPAGRSALKSLDDRRFAALAKKDAGEVSQALAPDLVEVFGHDPKALPGRGRTQRRVAMSKAAALVSNYLQQKPGNVAHARLATLKALLAQPEFQNKLVGELETRLQSKDPSAVEHMRKILPLVLEHAESILRPDTDREALLQGMEEAVMVSKEFADAHPPKRRALRTSGKMQFFTGVRG